MINLLTGIDAALVDLKIIAAAFNRLETTLQHLRQASLQVRLSELPPCEVPVTDHRREHRADPVPKIATGPELQALILARIDRVTCQQIADAVAEHFPPERRLRKSPHPRLAPENRSARPGRVLSRDDLLRLAPAQGEDPLDRSIDNRVARLRRKLEAMGIDPGLIGMSRGAGCVYRPAPGGVRGARPGADADRHRPGSLRSRNPTAAGRGSRPAGRRSPPAPPRSPCCRSCSRPHRCGRPNGAR